MSKKRVIRAILNVVADCTKATTHQQVEQTVEEPDQLESIVRSMLGKLETKMGVTADIDDLQCFSPAYHNPPHVIRNTVV